MTTFQMKAWTSTDEYRATHVLLSVSKYEYSNTPGMLEMVDVMTPFSLREEQ